MANESSALVGTHDATALAAMVRSGDVSARDLTEAALGRIADRDDAINAVIHRMDEKALAQVDAGLRDGPFTGVPIVIKDLYASTAGDPMHNGTRALRNHGYIAPADCNLVTRYRQAGFVIVGRTNTPEFGLVGTTEPEAHGPTRSPWNTDFGVGGSSGGSAAAVAAGMVPVGHASDGGGSIRIPAAMCGLVGLKPSRGRIPMGPNGEEWGLSVQHVVTRSVRDAAGILDISTHFPGDGVIAPGDGTPFADAVGRDPGRLRIAVVADEARLGVPVDPEVLAMTRRVADQLDGLGHDVVEIQPEFWNDPMIQRRFMAVWSVGASRSLERLGEMLGREVSEDDVEPSTWLMAGVGRTKTGTELMAAFDAMAQFRRNMADWWSSNCDLMLTPTTAAPPPPIGKLVSTPEDPMAGSSGSKPYAVFTSPFNITGQPGISVPMALTDTGLPIGAQLVGSYGADATVLSVAAQLEPSFVPVAPAHS